MPLCSTITTFSSLLLIVWTGATIIQKAVNPEVNTAFCNGLNSTKNGTSNDLLVRPRKNSDEISTADFAKMKQVLEAFLVPSMDGSKLEKLLTGMSKLNEETRLASFNYVLTKIGTNRPKEDPFTVPAVGALRNPFVPEMVHQIFSSGNKCLRTRGNPRSLYLEENLGSSETKWIPKTMEDPQCSKKQWKLTAVENGIYFLLTNDFRGRSLGIGEGNGLSSPKELFTKAQDPTLTSDPAFLWRISLVHEDGGIYLEFINHKFGLVLDVNDSGDVYPREHNGGTFQHWSLL